MTFQKRAAAVTNVISFAMIWSWIKSQWWLEHHHDIIQWGNLTGVFWGSAQRFVPFGLQLWMQIILKQQEESWVICKTYLKCNWMHFSFALHVVSLHVLHMTPQYLPHQETSITKTLFFANRFQIFICKYLFIEIQDLGLEDYNWPQCLC